MSGPMTASTSPPRPCSGTCSSSGYADTALGDLIDKLAGRRCLGRRPGRGHRRPRRVASRPGSRTRSPDRDEPARGLPGAVVHQGARRRGWGRRRRNGPHRSTSCRRSWTCSTSRATSSSTGSPSSATSGPSEAPLVFTQGPTIMSGGVDDAIAVAARNADRLPHGDGWRSVAAPGPYGALVGESFDDLDVTRRHRVVAGRSTRPNCSEPSSPESSCP